MCAEPLHRRIRQDLEAKIQSGEWPAGARVPTEVELEQQYGVSRTTVQRALYDLTTAGLVERHRRRGTFVTDTATETNLVRFVNLFLQDPVAPGDHEGTTSTVLLARDSDLTHTDLDPTDTLVRLERTKLSPAGDPVALETAVIPFRLVPNHADHGWVTSTTHQALRGNGHNPARVKLYVEAGGLDQRQAELLRLEPATPVLRCVRYTWLADGSMAEISRYLLSPAANRLYLERSLDEPAT